MRGAGPEGARQRRDRVPLLAAAGRRAAACLFAHALCSLSPASFLSSSPLVLSGCVPTSRGAGHVPLCCCATHPPQPLPAQAACMFLLLRMCYRSTVIGPTGLASRVAGRKARVWAKPARLLRGCGAAGTRKEGAGGGRIGASSPRGRSAMFQHGAARLLLLLLARPKGRSTDKNLPGRGAVAFTASGRRLRCRRRALPAPPPLWWGRSPPPS